MLIVALVFVIWGLYAIIMAIANIITLKKMKASPLLVDGPLVSICIPARNEENNIGSCLESMKNQLYKNIEILVLDDNSTDNTEQIIKDHMKLDPRIKYLKGSKLPEGWKGKQNAMKQLVENAKGEYIFFTDADTIHTNKSVAYGYSIAKEYGGEFISGYPKENIGKFFAAVVVSAMVFNTSLFVPIALQNKLQAKCYAMSIGQYLFMKKSALLEIGGIERIKDSITDDVCLAREMAATGHKQLFIDLKDVLECKMYSNFPDAFRGLGRSILGVIPMALLPLIFFAVVLLTAASLSLIVSTIMLILKGYDVYWMAICIGSFLLWLSWFLCAKFHGFKTSVAVSQPLAYFITVCLYCYGIFKRKTKSKVIWKGREV